MTMANNKTIHILRYGTIAEKIHLEKAISAYDYLGINGNSAAFVSNAIAKFIVQKFFSRKDKGYFIDPITYAFQNKIELLMSTSKATGKKSIKKSIAKLIEYYGYPINKVESGSSICPDDFSDDNIKENFVEKVLSFQYDLVYNHIKEQDLQKYLDYVTPNQAKNIPQFRPKFLIAPYFYLDSQDPRWRNWLNLNIEFAHISMERFSKKLNLPIFSQIVIDKSTLKNDDMLNEIINRYSHISCDGFTIWVDDLNEHDASFDELSAFVKLLMGLKQKPVYNMYGGYFSILLTHKSTGLLSGVSHGLEYGESRMVFPVGGGIPVSKYYYMPLHQRLDFTKAYYLLEFANIIDTTKENWGSSDMYYKEICRCSQCKKVIKDQMINFVEFESREFYEVHRKDQILRRKKASSDTKENCLYHYLLCKKIEFSKVREQNIYDLLDELQVNMEKYQQCEFLKDDSFDYVSVWKAVCENILER